MDDKSRQLTKLGTVDKERNRERTLILGAAFTKIKVSFNDNEFIEHKFLSSY